MKIVGTLLVAVTATAAVVLTLRDPAEQLSPQSSNTAIAAAVPTLPTPESLVEDAVLEPSLVVDERLPIKASYREAATVAPTTPESTMPVIWAMVPRWVVMQPLGRPVVPEV